MALTPPCRASYKYIDECRLPKYFTVRPHHTQLHAQLLRPSFGAVSPCRPCHPCPSVPTRLTVYSRSLVRAGGARAGGRSAMPQHACLPAQARRDPLRSGAPHPPRTQTETLALYSGPFTRLAYRRLTTALLTRAQKPENILMESLATCKIKVIDYGNAYLHHDQRCSYVQSRAYRAPEVVLGLPYSPKVDMWSLGCILMELFTGKLLFDNRSVQARRLHMPAPRMLGCLLQ